MGRAIRMLSIGMSILGLAHYYVWARLVRAPELPGAVYVTLTVALVLLWLSIPLTLIFGRRLAARSGYLIWPGYVWLGALFLFWVSTLAGDLVRALIWGFEQLTGVPPDAGRELSQTRLVAGVSAAVAGVLLAASLWFGRRVIVKRVEVPLGRLPESLHGTRIVQLSDVHIGPTLGRSFMERVVAQVNALEPDIIAITGDLVDGSVARLSGDVAPLGELRARYGVFFVTGNHEYYSGADAWCSHLTELGLRVLRNERVSIGTPGESFDLAGVDDYSAHHFGEGHGARLDRALAGRDPSRELVLLAHQPRAVLEAERAEVGLQISGHTHGGQIWPFNFLVRLQQPITSGLVRFGRSLVYVSNGTGYWGPPMRLGSPAEISEIVLLSRSLKAS